MRDHLLEAVRTFTRAILNPFDLDDLLCRLIDQTTATLGAEGAGIMLDDGQGDLAYAASSGEAVGDVERAQEKARTGACYEAYVCNQIVAVDDLRATERWPEYSERAVGWGFNSVIGMPLHAWGQTIGVLNVYRAEPGPWTDRDVEACEILAAMGAGYILSVSQAKAQHELAEHLQAALLSRGVIERAKGILMLRDGLDTTAAFEALREMSMTTNRKLFEVAQELVAEVERHGATGRPGLQSSDR